MNYAKPAQGKYRIIDVCLTINKRLNFSESHKVYPHHVLYWKKCGVIHKKQNGVYKKNTFTIEEVDKLVESAYLIQVLGVKPSRVGEALPLLKSLNLTNGQQLGTDTSMGIETKSGR